LTSLIAEKEPKISKLSGFNLSKSDADDLDSSTTLATSKAVKKVKDALQSLNLSWSNITGKPHFGLKSGEFMEGHRLAESLGVKEYGGLISSPGQKKEGNAYYDSNTKNMFYCKQTNSYTSANSSYFEPFDNKELLNRLNNLFDSKMAFCGLVKYRGRIETIDIPHKAKYVWFYDSQSYPSYGFVYSHFIELDSYGNGTQKGGFEIWGIKVQNYKMKIDFQSNTDNAVLVFVLW
ncbi:hypothetical protein MWG05_11690, partial [Fusobacterium necrophorum]|nr:hypothetical protein [Fusobacterium necrophorum]